MIHKEKMYVGINWESRSRIAISQNDDHQISKTIKYNLGSNESFKLLRAIIYLTFYLWKYWS